VLSGIASLLRLASILLCLVVCVSFALFAINQTSAASAHQQRELNNNELPAPTQAGTPGATTRPAGTDGRAKKGSVRRTIDEVAEGVTSPFSGLVVGSSSEWLKRTLLLLLALLVYGLGLGFLARSIRVRL
jgi:hypothetical protein